MGMMDVPRCQQIKVNGVQCGSPALRHHRHCFFHKRLRDRHARILRHRPAFALPIVEDANSLHLALMHVLQELAAGRLENKRAGLMLYGLQTVSGNLKRVCFEPEHAYDVVIDRDTVDQTCIGGPQWISSEFGETEPLPDKIQPSRAGHGEGNITIQAAIPPEIHAQAAPEPEKVKKPPHRIGASGPRKISRHAGPVRPPAASIPAAKRRKGAAHSLPRAGRGGASRGFENTKLISPEGAKETFPSRPVSRGAPSNGKSPHFNDRTMSA